MCSYLLIGFWFTRKSAADAGKKAFIVNRVGDFGFILAIILIYWTFERVDFQSVFRTPGDTTCLPVEPLGSVGVLTTICLLLFLGAAGKSAQFPLYVWLPDAMEGPTPVSALIHAATMVTAGVYMVARSAALYNHAPGALLGCRVRRRVHSDLRGIDRTGSNRHQESSRLLDGQPARLHVPCVRRGCIRSWHIPFDDARVLQSAFCFSAPAASFTGWAGLQDIRKMGGLRQHMPWTYRTFLVGTLAIAGIPGLCGLLQQGCDSLGRMEFPDYGKLLWVVGVIAAGFTSFYMFRLVILTFHGAPRYSQARCRTTFTNRRRRC